MITKNKGVITLNKKNETSIDSLTKAEIAAIASLKHNLKKEFSLDSVILFGSKARGDHNKDSDVDLLVIVDGPAEYKNKSRLSDLAFEANYVYLTGLSCKLQNLQDWKSGKDLFPTFIANVMKEGIEIEL